ncbi:MAG: hypothetical protein JXX14_03065 [Deltaproteobacteria bacterium]|nr:hypothetical protein [Deltaproteobacteria bacterium]
MSENHKKRIHPYAEEWPFAALMSLQFFLIIGIFWILKPLKKSIFIQYYDNRSLTLGGAQFDAAQTELLAKNVNMVLAFLAMLLLVFLVRKYKKQHLISVISAMLIMGAAGLLILVPGGQNFAWAFYAYGDVFNMLMLAAFFSFLNDSVSTEQAKRMLGTVVFGGVLGGAIGATSTRGLLGHLSVSQWLLVCAVITVLIAALAHVAAGYAAPSNTHKPTLSSATQPLNTFSLKQLIRSKYVIAIAVIAGSYEMVSTLVDFQFTSAVSRNLNGDAIGSFFSTVYMTVNIVSLSVQVLLTGVIMTRLGITRALLVLPVALLFGSMAFLAMPILLIGAALCIFDNGLNYSINQSARESLYVLIPSEAKYKAKAWVDVFINRTAKAVSVNLTLLLSAVLSFRWLAVVSVCLIVLWIIAAKYAGRQFDSDESAEFQWPQNEKRKRLLKKPRLFPTVPL